jgi:hypothetical protein
MSERTKFTFQNRLEQIVQTMADKHYYLIKNSDTLKEIKAALRETQAETQAETIKLVGREIAKLAKGSNP